MALTKITPQMFDTSAAGHDFNIDNGTFVVDASANRVGIGTSSPSEKLDVDGIIQINRTGDHPAIRFLEGGTTRGYIGSADWAVTGGGTADFGISSGSSGNLLLGTNAGVERMRIASDGTIQIPNQNAINELQFTGTEHTNIYSSTTAGMDVGTTGSGYLRFLTNNVERIRITSAGNVGIGTSSPNTTLTLSDGTDEFDFGVTTNQLMIKAVTSDGADDQRILIDAGNGGQSSARGAYIALSGNEASAEAGKIIYQTGNVTGASHVFRKAGGNDAATIDSSGNVGIGTSSPNAVVTINKGAGSSSPTTFSPSNSYLQLGTTDYNSSGSVYAIGFGYSGGASHSPAYLGFQLTSVGSYTKGDLVFRTRDSTDDVATTERMRINSEGHVTAPYNPAFRAYLSTEQTSNGVVSSGWSDSGLTLGRSYDRDGDFNTSNGRFTAPVDGVYLFSIMWDSNASQAGFDLVVNGATGYNVRWEPTGRTDDAWESKHYSAHVKLDKDDYVQIVIRHASGSYPVHMGGGYWGHFAGCLIS